MILEKVTGMEFDVFLKESIFDVCGMKSTGFFSFDRLPARCANHYIKCDDSEGFRTNIYSVGAKGTGDGGAFVTAGDIISFWRGLLKADVILFGKLDADISLSWLFIKIH